MVVLVLKRTLCLIVLLLCCSRQSVKAVDVSAEAGIVYHPATQQVLWERSSDEKLLIASTTKIMTALIALERCDLTETVTVTAEMANVEGSSMYLQVGQDYTVEELLYGLMLASGNDAATALAIHTAGSEAAFAELMNSKARELGLENTSFENPHGLDGTLHYSTAYDMARLAACAMDDPDFQKIVGTRHTTIKGLTYVNHNRLLWQCEGVIGVKTGYTKAAGRTLVTCCEREGERLICVTLSDPDDWKDHKALYDWAYQTYRVRTLLGKDTRFEVPLLTGDGTSAPVEPLYDVTIFAGDGCKVSYQVELPGVDFGPVYAGEKAGQVLVKIDGNTVGQVPLVYMNTYEIENRTLPGKWFAGSV